MSTQRATPAAAARTADFRSSAIGSHGRTTSVDSSSGRRPSQPANTLEQRSDELDVLIRDVRLGVRSQREFEQLADRAEKIAAGIRAVFRSATPPEPVHPPLWQQGGKAAW